MTGGLHRVGARAFATMVIAAMVLASGAAFAPAATAKTDTKFCSAAQKLQDKLDAVSSGSGKTFNASTYKTAGNAFKSAAKSAPAKVKKAMSRIGSFLSDLGGGDAVAAARALASENGKNYAKDIVTYTSYYAANCSSS